MAAAAAALAACSGLPLQPAPTLGPRDGCDLSTLERSEVGARVSAGLARETAADRFRGLRAVLVSVCGVPLVTRYLGSAPEDHHNVASVTPSIVSALAGIAIEDGLIRDVDQTVEQLLPEERAAMSREMAGLTLRQLLTMTAGLEVDRDEEPSPWELSAAEVSDILRSGVRQGPGFFGYSSASAHLVAAIVARAAGRPLLAYARERLFDPLQIRSTPAEQAVVEKGQVAPAYDRAGFAWPVDHQGVNRGDGWLRLTAADLLSIGQLYLDNGRAGGRQVVAAEWVRASTVRQVRTNAGPYGEGYGYLWWVTTADGVPAYTAAGFGGQLVEVVPSRHLVAVFVTERSTGKASNDAQDVRVDARAYADLVSRVVAPNLP